MKSNDGLRIERIGGSSGADLKGSSAFGLSSDQAAGAGSKWPHRLAIATAGATFPLLFIGGLVTSKGAGLAVPDWPTTFGYNMFLYPWSQMVGGIFYEHSHRLVASAVGLLTIALALVMWFQEQRKWLRWLGVVALGLVIIQGVLGGLRVVLLEHNLAILHAAFAQAFFALTVSLALFTSPGWSAEPNAARIEDSDRLARLSLITTALIYIQVVFGAIVRHSGERLDAHLLFALLIGLHIVLLVRRISKTHRDRAELFGPALFLTVLWLLQLALGGASYLGKFTTLVRLAPDTLVLVTTTHLVIGALMLMASLILTLRAYRFSHASKRASERQVLARPSSA